MFKRALLVTALLGVLGIPALQAAPVLTLDPVGGALTGAPGTTVGWGFTITNTTDYLVVTSADFQALPPWGTFTDFIAQFNFIVVGPAPESTSVSQTFDNTLLTGIGSFAIDLGAIVGQSVTGNIVLTYDLFSVSPNDPSFDPGADLLADSVSLSAPASVTVVAASSVPEPATWILSAGGILAFAWLRRKRISHHSPAN